MHRDAFLSPSWHLARTLTERLADLRAHPGAGADAKLAAFRLGRWRAQPPFDVDAVFAQRLAADGLREAEFTQLLGESAATIASRQSEAPAWLKQLEEAFRAPAAPPAAPEDLQMGELLDAVAPVSAWGRERLRHGAQELIQAHPAAPFDADAVTDLCFANLAGPLRRMITRTLVLELHVARRQGLLTGETSEERYASFLERLRQPAVMLALLEEYPVLARQVMRMVDLWVRSSLEFLGHLCADWQLIREKLSPDADPGMLTHIRGQAGDPHREGRAVLIAAFESGFRVVYKPKPLASDLHFQELLDWVNAKGDHAPFRVLTILDRGEYGWVEFVEARGCDAADQVRRFYERQGGYLALLYALEATDLHSENLIASGEHPVLIDLEALFHPPQGSADGLAPATAAIQHSVLAIGLLPQRVGGSAQGEGVDISGLGAQPGQLSPVASPTWEGMGSDELSFTRKRMVMDPDANRPTLGGEDVRTGDHTGAICDGFVRMYRLLLAHRDQLLAPDGPLARFANDPVRVVLRATQTYSILFYESSHPDTCRDALERDRLFDRLWATVGQEPQLARVIPAEVADLWRLDVPMFTTRPDSRDLWTSSGERIADFFVQTGMQRVRRCLARMSESDLERQLWITRASLATLPAEGGKVPMPAYQLERPASSAPPERERLIGLARKIGDRLEALAVRDGGAASWISLAFGESKSWSVQALGVDLYEGLPGVALFLARLGQVTGEERYLALARAALASVRAQLPARREEMTLIGAFEGWGGLIYGFSHLAGALNDGGLLDEAESFVELLPPLIERDGQLDIISGAAGCIAALRSLYAVRPSESTRKAALLCGERLLTSSRRVGRGIAWPPAMEARGPLTGFSHGAAGIAWALLELAALSGENRFRAAAEGAIAYERGLFSPDAGNWPDLRTEGETGEGPPGYFVAWCHGAPGVGLGRLEVKRHLADPALDAEIAHAVETTLRAGFGRNHSLCHGDLGNLELLTRAAADPNAMPYWRGEADRTAAAIVGNIEKSGWLCAVPAGVETPGLMTGMAGIGYGLLRLAEPGRVPSLLTLDVPLEGRHAT